MKQEGLLELTTPRLNLLALSRPQLRTALENKRTLELKLGLSFADALWSDPVQRALSAKLTRMARVPPSQHLWCTYWLMVLPADQLGIGLLGFKGSPNSQGEVELGYGVAPAFRAAGYTTEAARVLLDWALGQTLCSTVTAEVAKDNLASRRVLEKLGLRLVNVSGATYQYKTIGG